MLKRRIEIKLESLKKGKKALLITGARQVGKSYIIRQFGKANYSSFVEINLLTDTKAITLLKKATTTDEVLVSLSALTKVPLKKGETLFFIDEVQELPDFITFVKFLVEDGRYRFILSGSLIGENLKSIRSFPVGYMDIVQMYPLSFEEFFIANGVQSEVLNYIQQCYEERKAVDESIHEKLMALIRLYLIIGGMPEAVQTYLDTKDLNRVLEVQQNIINQYKKDISKYDYSNKLYINEILEVIPNELNNKNKRFVLKNVNEKGRFSKYENSFIWLKEAGVALPIYVVDEPVLPLILSKKSNLFKLFLNDVGLLASLYSDPELQYKILNNELSINYGSVFENTVAQELNTHGFNLYYYNSKKLGEVDFLLEYRSRLLPLKVKSGKDYKRHKAIDNLLFTHKEINEAIVLGDYNLLKEERVLYLPLYMAMFLDYKNEAPSKSFIYEVDVSNLKVPKL